MLAKLKILAFSDERLKERAGTFEVQINPEKYAHAFNVAFSEDKGVDTARVISKFKTQQPQDINFDFYLDATGVVPGVTSVTEEIDEFKRVAYNYKGEIHSPNYLKLLWGDLDFNCMLASLTVDYTLFSPSGIPLRARLAAKFRQHYTPEELAKLSDKKSADLSHSRTVVAGMTLPLMCHHIYGDSRYYSAVARKNDMNDLVHLVEGAEIKFPPLKD